MDILCYLHDAPQRGQLSHPFDLWIKLLTTCDADFEQALSELKVGKVIEMSHVRHGNSHGIVTLKSRRIIREEKARADWRKRQQHKRSSSIVTPKSQ